MNVLLGSAIGVFFLVAAVPPTPAPYMGKWYVRAAIGAVLGGLVGYWGV